MDELIGDAMRSGAFDNLPGKGKPLNLPGNPQDRDTALAYQLLKDNDYTLPWIAGRNEVLASIEEKRAEIARVSDRYRVEYETTPDDAVRMSLRGGWRQQLVSWQEQLAAINKRVEDVNLRQPSPGLEIYKMSLERELVRAGSGWELE
jgi:hypothetical protein